MVRKKGTNFSGYVCEVLEEKLKEEGKSTLFEAFSLVAEDEEVNVNYAFKAQREAITHYI